jgi:hypothetical protein
MLGIVVMVVVWSVFRLKIHQDNIYFLFFKIYFDISTSKLSKNIKKSILNKKIIIFVKQLLGWVSKHNHNQYHI